MTNLEVLTIGYEGRTQEEFISMLLENRIKQVLDVRHITSSRKKGFSKNQLASALEQSGLRYISMRELGTPDDMRRAYKAGESVDKFDREYAAYISTKSEELEELKRHLREQRSVLMCYEKDPKLCHRNVLAQMLEREGFRVEHLP